jgi:hypothetical protein
MNYFVLGILTSTSYPPKSSTVFTSFINTNVSEEHIASNFLVLSTRMFFQKVLLTYSSRYRNLLEDFMILSLLWSTTFREPGYKWNCFEIRPSSNSSSSSHSHTPLIVTCRMEFENHVFLFRIDPIVCCMEVSHLLNPRCLMYDIEDDWQWPKTDTGVHATEGLQIRYSLPANSAHRSWALKCLNIKG